MEYINEWRKQRAKEEEELKRLKEKQSKRKEIRAEQEKKLAQQKKEEEEYEEEETKTNPDERKSMRSAMSEGDGNFLKARQEAKKGELDEQLREYINEWRKQRAKEEEELKRLKEKQSKRKEI